MVDLRAMLIALIAALHLAAPQSAIAAPPEEEPAEPADMTDTQKVEELAAHAARLVGSRQYEDAVRLYLRAYQITPSAPLLYNVAYIYDRKVQERNLAMEFYRRYISAPDAQPDGIARATERLTELRRDEMIELHAKPGQAPVTQPAVVEATGDDGPMSSRELWSWVAVGGGAALAAGGVVVGLMAQGNKSDYDAARTVAAKQASKDAGQLNAMTADALLLTGAAAAITGGVLLLLAPSDDAVEATGARVRLVPWGAGAAIGGTF